MTAGEPWLNWHDRLHRQLLQNPQLLPKGTTLLLAVSGGQDSMALLGLLRDLSDQHHWTLELWHGDHGWHPESALIASDLASWCQTQQLKLLVLISSGSCCVWHQLAKSLAMRADCGCHPWSPCQSCRVQ